MRGAVVTIGALVLAAAGCGRIGFDPRSDAAPPARLAHTISVGREHACALCGSGVACWGHNNAGQLGNAQLVDSPTPVLAQGLPSVASVVAGGFFTCAIANDGSIWCWGLNSDGQVGTRSVASPQLVPVQVAGVSSVRAAAASESCICVTAEGGLRCWGRARGGEIGDGSSASTQLDPTAPALAGYSDVIAAGQAFVCDGDGPVLRCWGTNDFGQLGVTSATTTDSCVLVGGGSAACSLLPVTADSSLAYDSIVGGSQHGCGTSGGTVACWGRGAEGQLGDRSMTDRSAAMKVAGLPGTATAVAAGDLMSCSLLSDQSVWCWGTVSAGTLGDGTTKVSATPVRVAIDGVIEIASHENAGTVCARKTDGSVWCWGSNTVGQIGDGTMTAATVPTRVQLACP